MQNFSFLFFREKKNFVCMIKKKRLYPAIEVVVRSIETLVWAIGPQWVYDR